MGVQTGSGQGQLALKWILVMHSGDCPEGWRYVAPGYRTTLHDARLQLILNEERGGLIAGQTSRTGAELIRATVTTTLADG